MLYVIRFANTSLAFDGTLEANHFVATKLRVATTTPVASAELELQVPLLIAEQLFETTGPDYLFKTKAQLTIELAKLETDITEAADSIAREAKVVLLQEFRARRLELRDKLQNIILNVETFGGASFFGVNSIADAQLSAVVSLYLDALFEADVSDVDTVFSASANTKLNVAINGTTHVIGAALSVRLDRGDVIKALPQFSIPALAWPKMPKLELIIPPVSFPSLSFDALTFPNISQLLDFSLPNLQTPPISLTWDNGDSPVVKCTVTDGSLSFETEAAKSGFIFWESTTQLARIENFSFNLVPDILTVTGGISRVQSASPLKQNINVNDPRVPVLLRGTLELESGVTGSYELGTGTGELDLVSKIQIARLEIEARTDPKVFLAIKLTYVTTFDATTGTASGRLTELSIIEPYPIELIAAGLHEAIAGAIRFVALIKTLDTPSPDLPDMPDPTALLQRLGEFAAAIAQWAAEAAGAVASALAGLAEVVTDVIARFFELIKKAGSKLISHVAIEVRLDAETFALRQIWISPLGQDDVGEAGIDSIDALGMTLKLPRQWKPALVIDVSNSPPLIALVVQPSAGSAVLSTDLWLARPGAPVEAVRDSHREGQALEEPLIRLTAERTRDITIALIAIQDGRAMFFRKLEEVPVVDALDQFGSAFQPPAGKYKLSLLKEPLRFGEFKIGGDTDDLKIAVALASNADKRLFPFLSAPKPDDAEKTTNGGVLDGLSQYIEIKSSDCKPKVENNSVNLFVPIRVKVSEFSADTTLVLKLDLKSLHISVQADNKVEVRVPKEELEKPRSLLGLDARFDYTKAKPTDDKYPLFVLDFSGGDVRLSLAEDIDLELWYRRIASEGRGLVFKIENFAIGRHGIDLDARADRDVPVTLAGVEVPFRFEEGGVSIKAGRLTSFAVKGSGQLPPALIGEANVKIAIAMGIKGGHLTVQSAEAILDKGSDPIVCKSTRFTFTLQKVELLARDFGADGIHFWFALTGTARFTPGGSEFAGGLLKNLNELEIVFDKAPLTTNVALLKKHLEFHIGVRMKRAVNFFNIFKFELRGFGFHPSVDRFGGIPALSISGQLEFIKAGDTISPKMDFHKLWIAPPKDGNAWPQIAFDGLGIEVKLGTATLEGTAVSVDGNLPSLDRQVVYPEAITAQGFLARGRLRIKGWAPLAASMGFLELSRPNGLQHAFFAFAQQEELSIEIPTPIGTFYLREIGFGFGKSYTFAGLVAADYVRSPDQLVAVLDDVSKRQGELATFSAWAPELEGDRVTLAMRALFTVASGSNSGALSDDEKYLSNPIMFDISAALRSDLTFLMTARGWIATNYHAFVHGELEVDGKTVKVPRDVIRTTPPLRGYLYVSAPRQQFLGRLIADGTGYLGNTPVLHPMLRQAMSGVTWSATLFIQPGLFHFEMGWPYELSFKFDSKKGAAEISIRMEGGLVFRIEDSALLYGVAFRGKGHALLGGKVGGRSFGASATARVDMYLAAKFIAYISLRDSKDTLFYGVIDFAVTVSIRVVIWLEFKVFKSRIHLEIGLSFSRTLTLALELAISSSDVGARGVATLAVSGFGRTLRLGISLGINEGALERARIRVERFLAVGLDATVPEPTKGLAPPPPASSPANAAKQAERQSEIEEQKQAKAIEIAATIESSEIGAPSFWAILFEIPAADVNEPEFVMTLVPRDETEISSLSIPDGTFYPPPPPVKETEPNTAERPPNLEDYELLDWPSATGKRLLGDGLEEDVKRFLKFNDGAVIGVAEDSTDEVWLPNFLYHCFIGVKAADPTQKFDGDTLYGDTVLLKQPPLAVIRQTRQPLSDNEASATETLRRAARDQMIGDEESITDYIRAVEERRSGVISAIGESAAALAIAAHATESGPRYEWPARRRVGIDARDLGLTFVVKKSELEHLFNMTEETDEPVHSIFKIATRCSKVGQPNDPRPVHLLNPPSRFFRNAHPRLAGLISKRGKSGIMLDWDLEPQWQSSLGPYHDPEFLLRHYRIERLVLDDNSVDSRFKPFSFTTKAAAPFLLTPDGAIQPLRQAAQLVDDLADIAAIDQRLADVLLHQGSDAHENWKIFSHIQLLYTIVPVDIAGSEGLPTPHLFRPEEPAPVLRPLLKAEVIFHYEYLDDPVAVTSKPPNLRLFLRIDDPLAHPDPEVTGAQQRLPGNKSEYLVRLRREVAVAGGIYGIDALTKARERPTGQDFEQDAADRDLDFLVVLKDGETVLPNLDDGLGIRYSDADRFQPLEIVDPTDKPSLHPIRGTARFELAPEGNAPKVTRAQILKFLMDDPADVRGVRAAVSRMKFVSPKKPKSTLQTPSGWLTADMALVVLDPEVTDARPPVAVETVVEIIEHPRRMSFDALSLEDLAGRADRLVVVHPNPDQSLASLTALLEGGGASDRETQPFLRLVDRKRRTATRIEWNARPSETVTGRGFADPRVYEKLIGGFDIFETDLAELPEMADFSEYARCVARVQRLPETLRLVDPSEIVDFEKVEAFYPSETARILAQSARDGEGHAAWYSPAETLLVWPDIGPRVSLGLAPVPAELSAIFDKGQPTIIKMHFKEGGPFSLDATSDPKVSRVYLQFDQTHFWNIIEHPTPPSPAVAVFGCIRTDTQKLFGPGALMHLLRSLWWGADDVSAANIRQLYEDTPAMFRVVTLVIRGYNNGRVTGETEITVNLDFPLHPFLADVVDYLRWEIAEFEIPPYRRYEPVLDGPPPTKAESFSDFANEFPPDRDPYGWAFLRTLGLATGIKLFDMEAAEYVAPATTLKLLNAAFDAVAPRYAGSDVQPFVDMMLRPGGLYQLASFDSAIRTNFAQEETQKLIGEEGLSLIQLSLRPMREQSLGKTLIGYCLVKAEKPGTINVRPRKSLGGIRGGVIYEVLDIASGLGSSQVVRVASSEDTVAHKLLAAPNETLESRVEISSPGVNAALALVRIIAVGSVNFVDAMDNLKTDDVIPFAISHPSVVEASDQAEPFGRFGWLDPVILDVLHCGSSEHNLDVNPQADNSLKIERLLRLVSRRFSKYAMEALYENLEPSARRAFLTETQRFTARFIEHGAKLSAEDVDIPFALATVTRPDPWRVAPRNDGRMDILIIHEDAWARRRRYVVRPFGRYENIGAAASPTELTAEKPNLRELKTGDTAFDARSVDIVLPRTHPVRPPVILSARRLDIWLDSTLGSDSKQRREGRQLEFVLARHAEEIISEANRQVSDGYQFSHVGLEFYREFSAPRWARGFNIEGQWPQLNPQELVAPIGEPVGTLPDPPDLSFASKNLTELNRPPDMQLPMRIADGWSGIAAVRTGDVPYFYRLHLLAHAAAGVVVSEPSAAVIAEGRPVPRFPWCLPTGQVSPWEVPEPYWTVWIDRDNGRAEVRVTLPLMRQFDGLSSEDYNLWLRNTDFRTTRILQLPDAMTSYALSLETDTTAGSRANIVELFPKVSDTISTYSAIVGRAAFTTIADIEPVFGADHWQLQIPFTKTQETVALEYNPVLALGDDSRALLDTLEIDQAGWATWVTAAPTRQATITISRPPGTLKPNGHSVINWTPFIDEMNRLINIYGPYNDATPIVAQLSRFTAEPGNGHNRDYHWHTELALGHAVSATLPFSQWPAGFPRSWDPGGLLGSPVDGAQGAFIVQPVNDPSDWILPKPVERDATARMRFSDILRFNTPGHNTNATLNTLVFSVMRASMFAGVSRTALLDEVQSFDGFAPMTQLTINDLEPISSIDPALINAPFELLLSAECMPPGAWNDTTRNALRALIVALEACKLPGRQRALATLEAIDAGDALLGRTITPFTLVMAHTVRDAVTERITEFATALSVNLLWEARALTMRRPPDDGEIAALVAVVPVELQEQTRAALIAMAQDQVLGSHRKMVVTLYRGLALPLAHAVERKKV